MKRGERRIPLSIDELRTQVSKSVESIRDNTIQDMSNHVPVQPPTLYHYTGVDGFMGIVKSGKIWATNTRFLNDSQELSYAESVAEKVIKEKIASTPSFLEKLFLRYLELHLKDYSRLDSYVASFCAEPDLLSQWRGYGRNLGYAIGFDPEAKLSLMPIAEKFRVVNVVYDSVLQSKIIETTINAFMFDLTRMGTCDYWFADDALEEIAQITPLRHAKRDYQGENPHVKEALELIWIPCLCLRNELHLEFIRMKHAGFAEEQEWRIVYTETELDHPVQFRTHNGYIVPYLDLPLLPTGPASIPTGFKLKSVKCGPCNDPEAAIHSTKMWLRSQGYLVAPIDGVTVTGSSTPYRTW